MVIKELCRLASRAAIQVQNVPWISMVTGLPLEEQSGERQHTMYITIFDTRCPAQR